MGFLASVLGGLLPMFLYACFLYYLDRYEKEPLALLAGAFIWGGLIAAGAAFLINTFSGVGLLLLTKSELAAQFTLATLVAPLAEETLKGFALLLIFLFYRAELDSPLDGLIYGGITALGFAATENIWYIHQLGYLQDGWRGLLNLMFIRTVLVGWQHPFYTAFTGLGFALGRRSLTPLWKWLSPLLGWFAAIVFHLIHNLLALVLGNSRIWFLASLWDWSGYLGLLLLILLLIKREQRWMRIYLSPELEAKLISKEQYLTASSAWKQSLAFLRAIFQGSYQPTRQFYQSCGDYMHKSRQLLRHGDELGTELELQRLRAEITRLAGEIGIQQRDQKGKI